MVVETALGRKTAKQPAAPVDYQILVLLLFRGGRRMLRVETAVWNAAREYVHVMASPETEGGDPETAVVEEIPAQEEKKPAKKSAAKKTTAKKTTAGKTTAKKTAEKKTTAKKTTKKAAKEAEKA